MVQPRFLLAGALGALVLSLSPPTASAIDLFTEPIQPVDSYPTRLVARGFTQNFIASSTPLVERDGQKIKVYFGDYFCPFLCPPNTVVLGTDLGVLAAGDYQVEIYRIHADFSTSSAASSAILIETRSLRVKSGPRIETVPARPLAGEAFTLRLTGVVGRCPRVLPVQRDGNQIEVTVDLYGCSGAEQTSDLEVPLASLPAGNYSLVLTSLGQYLAQAAFAVSSPQTTLQNGRFAVDVSWENGAGGRGEGLPVQPPSRDSALFYFFSENNWELMVKVLDGCAINGFYWVFGAASTDVGYTVEISEVGGTRTFEFGNEAGQPAAATTSITAFPCE